MSADESFLAGTTSIQAADAEGWVVSITPSGGWIPAFIADETGIGLSQRMQSSLGSHKSEPGRLQVTPRVTPKVREKLQEMCYFVETIDRTYSPITAVYFDRANGTMWGGASDYGDDYGVAW